MKHDSNNRDTDIFADIGGLEPSDFYSERRDSSPTGEDFMKVLDERPSARPDAGVRRAPQPPQDDDILNSFHIATDSPATKRIFAEVDDFESRRRRQTDIAAGAITDEILRVDLPDDETFVEDVIDSYRTESADRDLAESRDVLFSVRVDEDADFSAPQTRQVSPSSPSIHLDFDGDAAQDRFATLSAALDDASANQDEIHKSIQIVLEDVKRHQDQDESLRDTVRRATRPVADQPEPETIPTLFVSERRGATEPATQPTEAVPAAPTADASDPAPYAANFKRPASEFVFQDNTVRSRRELRDVPTGPVMRTVLVEEEREAAPPPQTRTRTVRVPTDQIAAETTRIPTREVSPEAQPERAEPAPTARIPQKPEPTVNVHADDGEAQTQAIKLNGAVLDELRRYANEAVRQQMDVELAKLDGQRAQLEAIQKQQEALDRLREQDAENLSVNLDHIRGAEELENSRAALDEERERFREERRKMADEFFELSQRERENLAAERERLLSEARDQRERMLAEAQREIDVERERLQREIDAQREKLLEVAEREKERLLDAAKLAKTQYVDDTRVEDVREDEPTTPVPAVQSVLQAVADQQRDASIMTELRRLMSEIRELKEADAAKFEQLRSELSEEARNAVSEAISGSGVADKIERISTEQKENFEQLSDKIDAASALPPDYSEMLPVHEDRSYTERVIDDLEDDDARSEAEFVPVQSVRYEQPQYATQPIPVAPQYAPEPAYAYEPEPAPQPPQQPEPESDPGVDELREALRAPRDTDFEFDEKRLAYERDRVKEEIKREVLQEMGRLTGEAVKFSSSVTSQIDGHDGFDSEPSAPRTKNVGAVMTGSDAVPELAGGRANAAVRDATRLYDFDLFDELGIEAFEADDQLLREPTIPVPPPAPEPEPQPPAPEQTPPPAAPTAEVPPPPAFGAPSFTPPPLDLPPPEADKFKGRNAHLLLNHKYDNLSSADLIKSYARDLRRRIELKKK